jgi:GTPase SAR1 family protein
MAEAASQVPSFKLVLVGDGGTGKVTHINSFLERSCDRPCDQQVSLDLIFLGEQLSSSD